MRKSTQKVNMYYVTIISFLYPGIGGGGLNRILVQVLMSHCSPEQELLAISNLEQRYHYTHTWIQKNQSKTIIKLLSTFVEGRCCLSNKKEISRMHCALVNTGQLEINTFKNNQKPLLFLFYSFHFHLERVGILIYRSVNPLHLWMFCGDFILKLIKWSRRRLLN